MTDQEAEKLKSKFLTDNDYDTLIDFDCDAYNAATGELLFKFRRNALDIEKIKTAYEAVKKAVAKTEGRGTASGANKQRIKKDGTVSKMLVGNMVEAGLVGYMDRNGKQPYCRRTAFNKAHMEKFTLAIPFIKEVDNKFAELVPVNYQKQRELADATNRNYTITDTAFTTVTVNRNFVTAVHKDAGDYKEGFGNLVALRFGEYTGCYFCLPQFRVAINMQNSDLLLVDVHQWHGNTPLVPVTEDYMRISFVMYYRENMFQCKSPSEELARIKGLNGSKHFAG